VSLASQCFQLTLRLRILLQRLNESADGIERRQIHLLLQGLVLPGSKPAIDPFPVVFELELGSAHQKVVRAKTIKRSEPGFRA